LGYGNKKTSPYYGGGIAKNFPIKLKSKEKLARVPIKFNVFLYIVFSFKFKVLSDDKNNTKLQKCCIYFTILQNIFLIIKQFFLARIFITAQP
jgi:hypothetical protein